MGLEYKRGVVPLVLVDDYWHGAVTSSYP